MALRAIALVPLLALMFPLMTSAQLINPDTFSVSVSPQYLAPYGQAIISPLSSSLDIVNAVMTVTVNGTQTYKGSARPVAVSLGAAGSLASIKVTMTSNGSTFTKTLALRPQDVVLIAEPIASAPPLYRGKALVPLEGVTRVVAIANLRGAGGKSIAPAALSYDWFVDSTEIYNSSGIGKDTLNVASPLQYRARSVTVKIQSQDGSVSGGASLSLEPEEPTVRLYESDPLLGILFDHAVSDALSVASSEKSLYAAPYSFPTSTGLPVLQWFLNGSSAQRGSVITLRPTGSGSGSASLSLVASSGDLLTATANLGLSFGKAKGGLGIFGL